MALIDNRWQRTTMLCAMYFAQGLPWGFMVTALIAYLTDVYEINDTQAGRLTAIVIMPWTFKLVWAPLIDTMTIRSMGRRRPWIIGAELMMALSLLGILYMGDLSDNLTLLGWMFFLHNCFASLQDVATDALAVDILPPVEQGRVNGLMWGSKLIGKAIGSIGMAMIIYSWGLSAAVLVQFFLLLLIMLFPLLMVERPGEKRMPWSAVRQQSFPTPNHAIVTPDEVVAAGSENQNRPTQAVASNETRSKSVPVVVDSASSLRNPIDVLMDLKRGFSIITTFAFLLYGSFHVVGWGIVEVVHKTLYTQQLGWSYVALSQISGYAVFFEMAGALLGGYIADRFGRRKVIVVGFGTYGLLAIVFGACPQLWDDNWFAAGYLLLNPGALAFGAVGFLSMGMRISWTRASASMFTIYMTLSNVGHFIGNSIVGPLRNNYSFSYEQTFLLAGLAMVVPLVFLVVVKPGEVDQRKAEVSTP